MCCGTSTEDTESLANDWKNRVKAKRTGSSDVLALELSEAEGLDDLGVLGAGLPPDSRRALDE